MIAVNINKRIYVFLLITVGISLIAMLLVSGLKVKDLPQGFKRETAPVALTRPPQYTQYRPEPKTQLPVPTEVIKLARERITKDWGRDPFMFILTQTPEGYITLRVTAILITDDSKWACVNGQVMKTGDRLGECEVIEINEYGIKVLDTRGIHEISLQQ